VGNSGTKFVSGNTIKVDVFRLFRQGQWAYDPEILLRHCFPLVGEDTYLLEFPGKNIMTVKVEVPEAYQTLVDAALLEQAATCMLAAEHAAGDITVLLTDDEEVAELNQQFLGKTGPTDVLSFPALDEESDFILPPEEASVPYLGDIIIALPYTQRQAERFGRPLNHELALLVIHGTLHLLGYDHGTPGEKAEMWQKQNAVLSGLGIAPLED